MPNLLKGMLNIKFFTTVIHINYTCSNIGQYYVDMYMSHVMLSAYYYDKMK